MVKFKKDEEADKFLKEVSEALYLDGQCYEMAIALNRGLGWPIYGVMAKFSGGIPSEIRHAVVQMPDNNNKHGKPQYFDVRGAVCYFDLGKPFGIMPENMELRGISANALAEVREVSPIDVSRAVGFAAFRWPDLPWREKPVRARVLEFAAELETLSRKHGIWIRSPFPACLPILSDGDGSEGGYEVSQTADGLGHCIDRFFK